MPTYEMPLLLRIMSKPETSATLKRVANGIFGRGGIIRQIDNLGEKPTPYKISSHDQVYRRAAYFILHFDAPPRKIDDLLEECNRDVDLIRTRIYKRNEEEPKPCTLHEELLPPAYRPEVQKLIQFASTQKHGFTHEWNWNSGLTYYPFQR